MKYNTELTPLIIPEYGRHIHSMAKSLITIKDEKKRNQQAQVLINIMGNLNSHLRDVDEYKHKLWDHLFVISDFELKVDSPFELPTKESVNLKAESLKYPDTRFKYKHYGKTIQGIIKKAIEFPESLLLSIIKKSIS